MRKKILTLGIILLLLWTAVSFISLGLPKGICELINKLTGSLFSDVVNAMSHGFYYDVGNKDMPSIAFFFLFSIAFLIYFWAVVSVEKRKPSKDTLFLIILFSILFRLVLIPSYPVHENDFYRYLWDGKVAKSGINPYLHAPDRAKALLFIDGPNSRRFVALRTGNPIYFERIGHKQVPTIYPPVSQAVFLFSSLVREDSIVFLKFVLLFFDLLSIMLLVLLLRHFNLNPSLVIVYAWSPLVLKEIANSAHYESIPIFLMLLAMYLIFKQKKLLSSFAFSLAACAKFFPALLIPIFAKRMKLRSICTFTLISVLLYLPFIFWNKAGIGKVFKGLLTYSQQWAYNGSVFVLIESLFRGFNISLVNELFLPKLVVGIIFVTILFKLSGREERSDRELLMRAFAVMASLFLLNPVADAWYFCWVIPFLCFFRYRAFLILSWLLIFSYISFRAETEILVIGVLEIPVLSMVQYIPFYGLLLWELIVRKDRYCSNA